MHSIVLNLGVLFVANDLERHGVAQVAALGFLELRQDVARRARHAQVDVLGGTGALQPKLENEASLQHHRFAEHGNGVCQKAIEHEQLALARKRRARRRSRSEALFERLL